MTCGAKLPSRSLLKATQGRERIGASFRRSLITTHPPRRKRQGLRADVVHRHQRNRHQQLVFDQSQQVRFGLQSQDIFLALVVLGLGPGLVGNEPEPAVHLQRNKHRTEASLAPHRQIKRCTQVHPDGRLAGSVRTNPSLRRPSNQSAGLAASMNLGRQTVKRNQWIFVLQHSARLSEGAGIESTRVPGPVGGRFHRASVKDDARKPQTIGQ